MMLLMWVMLLTCKHSGRGGRRPRSHSRTSGWGPWVWPGSWEGRETQEPHEGEGKGEEHEGGAHSPLVLWKGILAHLGHYEELQAKDGDHHCQGGHDAGHQHAWDQPGHVGLTWVSETMQPRSTTVWRGGCRPGVTASTDGDKAEDHGQGGRQDDEGSVKDSKKGRWGLLWPATSVLDRGPVQRALHSILPCCLHVPSLRSAGSKFNVNKLPTTINQLLKKWHIMSHNEKWPS